MTLIDTSIDKLESCGRRPTTNTRQMMTTRDKDKYFVGQEGKTKQFCTGFFFLENHKQGRCNAIKLDVS